MVDGRANNGGQRANCGRKPKSYHEEMQAILKAGWPRTQRIAVVKKLAERAAKGDLKAAEFLFDHAYGKPKETRELSGPGGRAIEVDNRIQNVPSLDDLRRLEPGELLRIHRETLGLPEDA
jgi:hypothetical protein